MFQYERNELSEFELLTMKCIWDAKDSITCQEIMAKLREEYGVDYQDTTVYTYLKKLTRKGFVSSYRRGVIFFEAIRSEEEYRSEQMEKMKRIWYGGDSKKMVEGILSPENKEEKKRILLELIEEWE